MYLFLTVRCVSVSYRLRPSKVDLDVLKALKETTIDRELYPAVAYWYKNVRAHSIKDQMRYGTEAIV